MKQKMLFSLVLSAGIALGMGCGKKEESAPPSLGDTRSKAEATATSAAREAGASSKAAPAATSDLQTQAASAQQAASSQADSLIAEAKKLAESGKYQEAMNLIKQLSSMKLTPEQQKLVDDLKAMVQKQLANSAAQDASKAIGNALGGTR